MKITKYTHACLLVETDDSVAIFDPGNFAWDSGLFNVEELPNLNQVIITHEHGDHCHLPFIQALVTKFPRVKIIGTEEVVAKLAAENITATSSTEDDVIFFEAPHESMAPLMPNPICQNNGVHYRGLLTHPGDSHHFSETKDTLALPVAGPWGSMIEGVRLATKLKPKNIIPIHDAMNTKDSQMSGYDRLESYFKGLGINFIKTIDGEPFEL